MLMYSKFYQLKDSLFRSPISSEISCYYMQMAALTREPKVDRALLEIRYNEGRAYSKYLFFENVEKQSGPERVQSETGSRYKWRSDEACRATGYPGQKRRLCLPSPHDVLSLLSRMHPLSRTPPPEQAD